MWNNYYENTAYSSNIANQVGFEPNPKPIQYQNQYSLSFPDNFLYPSTDYLSFAAQSSEKIRQLPKKKNKVMSDTKNKIFIANLNHNTSEQELKSYFSKFGNLSEITVIKNRETQRPRGFGFLKYSDSFMVDEVMKNRPHCLGDRQLDVKRMIPKKSQNEKANLNSEKIYISGFGSDVSEQELINYFEKYGHILSINLKPPRIGMTMCYGFITFDDYDSVDKIILQNNHCIKGYCLKIRKCLQKEKENFEKTKIKKEFNLDKQFRFQPYTNSNSQNYYGTYQTSEQEQANFVDLLRSAVKQGYPINQNESNFGPERINNRKFNLINF